MDWHKLQHKLFEMDPVDPRKELENLRKITQTPTPLEEPDLLNESYAIKPGSMPLGIDSISDFAALAGIRLDEKQLKGPAGQARGSDPMPSAKFGRTEHPLKNKFVGGEDFSGSFAQGFNNYNTLDALRGNNTGSTAPRYQGGSSAPTQTKTAPDISNNVEHVARILQIRDIQRFSTAVVSASQGNPISSIEKQVLGEAFQNMLLLQESKKREVFRALIGLAPREASKTTATDKVSTKQPKQPKQTKQNTTTTTTTPQPVTSSKSYDTSKKTIKEHLLRLLEEKKK